MDYKKSLQAILLLMELREKFSDKKYEEACNYLMGCEYVVPANLRENEMSLFMISDKKNNKYIPSFSDIKNYNKRPKEWNAKAVELGFDKLVDIVIANISIKGIVINPYGENIVIGREMIEHCVSMQNNIKAGEEITFGIPAEYPIEYVNALKRKFNEIEDIKKAYLIQIVRRKSERSLLLVLDNINEEILGVCSSNAENHIKDEMPVDIVLYDESFAKEVTKGIEPFYQKEK